MIRIHIIGPPGSEKTTMAKRLAQSLRIPFFSNWIAGQGSRFCFTLPFAVPSALEQNNHITNALTDLLPLTSTRIAPGEELSDAAKSKKSE
jgi:cytidylate kinase